MSRQSNQSIGPYQIEGIIGSGGMGQIFRVRRGPKVYAMKVLRTTDPESIERFRREAQVLVQTDQLPYFARVYNFGMDPLPYIVMEYIEAPDLDSWRRQQQTFNEETALALTGKIAQGLESFHELGFVHRDLKPANILLKTTAEGDVEPVIIDFGLVSSECFEELTKTGELVGTPLTMAPEQWRGAGAARNKASDIWALGLIHYFLVTGDYPFNGTPAQICSQVNRFELNDLLDCVPPASQRVLLATLQKSIDDRSDSATKIFEHGVSQQNSRSWKRVVVILLTLCSILLSGAAVYLYQANARKTQQRQIQAKKIKELKAELDADFRSVCIDFYARRFFRVDQAVNQEWRENVGETLSDFCALLQKAEWLPERQRRENEQLAFSLYFCIDQNHDARPFKWTTKHGKRDELVIQNYLTLKSFSCSYKKLAQEHAIRDLSNAFVGGDTRQCWQEVSAIEFPAAVAKLRSYIRDEIVLTSMLERMKQCTKDERFAPEMFQYFDTSERLKARFSQMLPEAIRVVDDNCFENVVRTLIKYRIGFDVPWPKLDLARQSRLLRRWRAQIEGERTRLSSTGFKLCCLTIYLQAVYYGQAKKVPAGFESLDQPLALIFTTEEMVNKYRKEVCIILDIGYFHDFFSPIVALQRMTSRYESLYSLARAEVLSTTKTRQIRAAIRELVSASGLMFEEYETVSEIYNGASNVRRDYSEFVANYKRLLKVDIELLPPPLKSYYYLVVAMYLNRFVAEQLLPQRDELSRRLALQSNEIGPMAQELLSRIKPVYAMTRIFQLLELGCSTAKNNLERGLELNDQARKLIKENERTCRDQRFVTRTEDGRVYRVRVTPNRQKFVTLLRKASISRIRMLITANTESALDRAIAEAIKYKDVDPGIDRLHWWLGKIWHKTGDKASIVKVIKHFGFRTDPEIASQLRIIQHQRNIYKRVAEQEK